MQNFQNKINTSIKWLFITFLFSFLLDYFLQNLNAFRVVGYVLGVLLNGIAIGMEKLHIDSEFKYVGFIHFVLFGFLSIIVKNELPFGFLNLYISKSMVNNPVFSVFSIVVLGLISLLFVNFYFYRNKNR